MSNNHTHTLLHTYIAASKLSEKLKGDEEAQLSLAKVMSALRALDDGPTLEKLSATVRGHTTLVEQFQSFRIQAEYKLNRFQKSTDQHALHADLTQKNIEKLQSRIQALENARVKVSDEAIEIVFTPPEIFSRKVEEFPMSVRSANCLKAFNIIYIGDLVQKTDQELLRMSNFGRKSLREVRDEILYPLGLNFGISMQGWVRPADDDLTDSD
jgi:hypothetical protein